MKALKLTLLALAMALAGGYANATSYAAPATLDAGRSYTFENGLVALGATGFSDSFSFTLGSGVTSASFVFNLALPSSPSNSFAVSYSGNSVAFLGGNVTHVYTTTDEDNFTSTFTITDKTEYTFTLTGLSSGEKSINVSGNFAAAFPVAQNYSLTVSAVPEPESYALLLAGLGLMAGIARRKSKSN